MKSIKTSFILLFLLVTSTFSIKAYCVNAKKIHLTKTIHSLGLKSIITFGSKPSTYPFAEAYLQESGDLLLSFNMEQGTVKVSLTSSTGEIIYDESVEITPNMSLSIPILETEQGEWYKISLSNGHTKLEGAFSIEE